jgi:hypothetical protein
MVTFSSRMKKRGFRPRKSAGIRQYAGLRLRQPDPQEGW